MKIALNLLRITEIFAWVSFRSPSAVRAAGRGVHWEFTATRLGYAYWGIVNQFELLMSDAKGVTSTTGFFLISCFLGGDMRLP